MNIKKYFGKLGPGFITGAADDDPSGIATYSQAGAQFGYGLLWMAFFMLPLQAAIQEACARIGAVTGKGIAAILKENGNRKTLYFSVMLLIVANVINIGADLGAMAAAAQLIVPVNLLLLTLLFTAIILILEIFVSYASYANILKWLCLFLIAYPVTVFLIKVPWLSLFKKTFFPHVELHYEFLFMIVAILGTTISPYLFFWQASEEIEELYHCRLNNPQFKINRQYVRNIRIDNFFGMLFSEIGTWSIIVVTATILHGNGIVDIKTAADAAKALEPLVTTFPNAGFVAKLIFAVGIIGLGFLAIPVLSGSAAYAYCETFNCRASLNFKFKQARCFYGVIIVSTVVGLLINFFEINPIKALIYAAVINGVIAVPLILVIALIAKSEKIMGEYKSKKLSIIFVWITFFSMAVAAIALLFLL